MSDQSEPPSRFGTPTVIVHPPQQIDAGVSESDEQRAARAKGVALAARRREQYVVGSEFQRATHQDSARRWFAGVAFAFSVLLVGYLLCWVTLTLDCSMPGQADGGYLYGAYDWRRGIARAAVVLSGLAFAGVLLRFTERMALRNETVEKIELAKANAATQRQEASEDAAFMKRMGDVVDLVIAKFKPGE